jgi:hypothetical protein
MAADGFLVGLRGGSLDGELFADAYFRLTSKGEAIFGRLLHLRQWLASRAASTSS